MRLVEKIKNRQLLNQHRAAVRSASIKRIEAEIEIAHAIKDQASADPWTVRTEVQQLLFEQLREAAPKELTDMLEAYNNIMYAQPEGSPLWRALENATMYARTLRNRHAH